MNDEQINLLAHIYDKDQVVEFPGQLVYALMQVLENVAANEKVLGLPTSYAKTTKEIFDKERKMADGSKFLVSVEQELELFPTASSFFNQKPQETVSMLGAMAMDLLGGLKEIHLDNIKKGIAKPVGTFEKAKDEEPIKLS